MFYGGMEFTDSSRCAIWKQSVRVFLAAYARRQKEAAS